MLRGNKLQRMTLIRANQLMIALALSIGLATFICGSARADQTSESGVNRPGGDYKDFVMEPSIVGFAPCQAACTSDPSCRAWTYVVAGVQGPKPHCWLKNTVPNPVKDKCCVSGVSGVVASLEFGTNRPGSDYRNFDIGNADLRDQPELLCKTACQNEAQCRSWTYVKPGIQGPKARCWLKSAVPAAQANNCCISGLKEKPIKTTGKAKPTGGNPAAEAAANEAYAKMRQDETQVTGKTAAQCLESNSRCQARITAMVGQLTAMGAAIQSECAPFLQVCLANAAAAAAGTTSAGGGATPPPEWAEMLAVHNERRAQHCAPPLTWSNELAAAAQAYASTCTLYKHGSSGENMANWVAWEGPDETTEAASGQRQRGFSERLVLRGRQVRLQYV